MHFLDQLAGAVGYIVIACGVTVFLEYLFIKVTDYIVEICVNRATLVKALHLYMMEKRKK